MQRYNKSRYVAQDGRFLFCLFFAPNEAWYRIYGYFCKLADRYCFFDYLCSLIWKNISNGFSVR